MKKIIDFIVNHFAEICVAVLVVVAIVVVVLPLCIAVAKAFWTIALSEPTLLI